MECGSEHSDHAALRTITPPSSAQTHLPPPPAAPPSGAGTSAATGCGRPPPRRWGTGPWRRPDRRPFVVVRHDRASGAARAEVLAGVEARRRYAGEGTRTAVGRRRALRLRGILDNDHAVLVGDRVDRLEVGGLAVQVHGHDRL